MRRASRSCALLGNSPLTPTNVCSQPSLPSTIALQSGVLWPVLVTPTEKRVTGPASSQKGARLMPSVFKVTVTQYWLYDCWLGPDGQPCARDVPGARYVKRRKVTKHTPGARKVTKKSSKWY